MIQLKLLKGINLRVLALVVLLFTNAYFLNAQNSLNEKIELGKSYIEHGNYIPAFEIFSVLIEQYQDDPIVNYYFGVCLFYSDNGTSKVKSAQYFEMALSKQGWERPNDLFYFLARARCYQIRFVEALNFFNKYLELVDSDENERSKIERDIKITENAIKAYRRRLKDVTTAVLDFPINTSYDEYGPIVASGGQLLFYSSDRLQNTFNLVYGDDYAYLPANLQSDSEDVFMSNRRGLGWAFPDPLEIKAKVVRLLSISSDGSSMLLYMGESEETGDLYVSHVKKSRWTAPKKLTNKINSKYVERGACFGSGGNTIYFSSNRPGGNGGFDLYKIEKNLRGDWGEPMNLGGDVNSKYDELTPFLLNDNKTLFFSSNGHSTIGGLDIFTSQLRGSTWSMPKNMGYPINTVFNEDYFFRLDNKYSYLSSDRNETNALGGYDIISIFRPEKKLPLTMVNGVIRGYEDGRPIDVSIKVLNNHKDKQKYIYNPDVQTGKYFMILPPDGVYTMVLELGDGREYSLTLNIPKDTYRYEFNYEFEINSVNFLGQVIGGQVKVRDSYYSITSLENISPEDKIKEVRYDALLMVMEQIIDRSDIQGLQSLEELEQEVNYIDAVSELAEEYYTPILQIVDDAISEADPKRLSKLEIGPWERSPKKAFFYGEVALAEDDQKLLLRRSLKYSNQSHGFTERDSVVIESIAELLYKQSDLFLEIEWHDGNVGQFRQGNYLNIDEFISELKVFFKNRYVSNYRYEILGGKEYGSSILSKRENAVFLELRVYANVKGDKE